MDLEALEKELADQLEMIEKMPVGSDERLKATREYQTLHDVFVKERKAQSELETMNDDRMIKSAELADSRIQREHERIDGYVDRAIDIVKVVAGTALTGGAFLLGLEFEKEGAFTSKTMSNITNVLWKKFRL